MLQFLKTYSPESTLIPADDNHQDLTLLDRVPSPPHSIHRADDLPLPSASIQAEADSGGDVPVQADYMQIKQPDDFTVKPAASEVRDAPQTAEYHYSSNQQ
jgi:hypothetical protein